jgi:hypothetical protein
MDSDIIEKHIQDVLANNPELSEGEDAERMTSVMREILSEFPNGCGVTSGLAPGEENQKALDAWIEAGAIPGDEHLYGLVDEDGEDADEGVDGE